MIRKYFTTALIFLWFLDVYAQYSGEFKNLGPQITSAKIQGSAFVNGKDGKSYVYTVVRGRPAHLVGIDLSTNETVVDLALDNTDGSWRIAASTDDILYISTAQGKLFRHQPGSQKVDDLGFALSGEKVIWDVVAGKDGEIFGGTYPGCKVFRYHPRDGFSAISDEAVEEGEQYARYLAYDSLSNKLYVGVRIGISIHEFDLNTGSKKTVLSADSVKSTSFYNLKVVHSTKGSRLLIGLKDNKGTRETLVFDTKSFRVTDTLGAIDVRFLLNRQDEIYYSVNSTIFQAKLHSAVSEKSIKEGVGEVTASKWSSDEQLQWFTDEGELLTFDMKSKQIQRVVLTIPRQPIDIQSVLFGPDNRIWTSGYLAGGNAAYDPATGQTIEYSGLIQSEGMSKQGSFIYFGIYPSAQLYRFDTSKPWDLGMNNPTLIKQVRGQSRPFAILSIDTAEKVYFGTIPEYSRLGGAVIEYDARAHTTKTYENIVYNQSPVSLTLKDGLIWGGTTISGGLGIAPTELEAKLFAWDLSRKETIYETVPVKGAMSITTLINGPDGNLWGIADGYLFVFDVKRKEVIHRQQIYQVAAGRTHSWRDAFLIIHPSGKIYGSGGQTFFVIDPSTMKAEVLRKRLSLLTMDNNGVFYLKNNADLWSYKPNIDKTKNTYEH